MYPAAATLIFHRATLTADSANGIFDYLLGLTQITTLDDV